MRRIIAAFARNSVFANILLLIILLAGGMASALMLKEMFPQFSLDMITVSVLYPGADPEEVEEGISRKIEETIERVEGVKQINTESGENASRTMIEVKEDYDTDEVLDRVRSKIDSISTFPVDAEKPIVSELLLKDMATLISLSGSMPERRLKEWAERMKDEIQQSPAISQVEIFGSRDYEIAIEVSEERLREYGLSFREVADAVRRSNLNLAGGTIRTRGEEIRVRTLGRKYTGEELASIVVLARPEGEIITLDRLAEIDDGFTEDPITATVNGERAVFLVVYKTEEEDTLAISDAIAKFVEEKRAVLPEGVNINVLVDTAEFLNARINLLVKNGLIGLSVVFLLLWIFLDLRLSFWAGMGMPISVAGALAILWAIGGTINMISLFGLIMVLGIIVDDAIVVGEAIYVHRKMGKPALRAAVDGVCEVGLPVIAAVTTTIAAFLPLAYVGGIMGKFIAILPVVVIACLTISLIECLILLPAHLSHLPDPNAPNGARHPWRRRVKNFHRFTSRGLEWFIEHVYRPFLSRSLQWRYVSFCVAVSILLVTLGLIQGGILKYRVFSDIDGFVITSTVEFPDGTPPDVTRDAIRQIEEAFLRIGERTETVSGEPLIEHRITLVGQTLQDPPKAGPNTGSVQIVLLDSEKRGVHANDLMVDWEEEIGTIPGVRSLIFEGMHAGPPGAPIEVWIQGQDMTNILRAADDLQERLKHFDGVYQVRSDFSPGKNELRLKLKPEARALGLTVDDLARQVYAGYYGEEANRIQRGRDDIRVKVRYTADERSRLTDLDRMRIRTQDGREVPLRSVADVEFSPGYSSITRTDGLRRVAVSAEVDSHKANAKEIIDVLQPSESLYDKILRWLGFEVEQKTGYLDDLTRRYPGTFVAIQGEQKKTRESMGSLKVGFPLALLGIFVIIATIFRSYAQPFLIMFTVPFGIIGAIIGHLLLGYDLSIMSMFGMVALAGVVVNDAIILIERVNENLAEGMGFFEAIESGGARRFRAVLLTTLSTIGGLTPLILEKDMQAQFLIPMALSLAAGVAFATLLTLVLIPGMFVILNDVRRMLRFLKEGVWPSREEVEPARNRRIDQLDEVGAEPRTATI